MKKALSLALVIVMMMALSISAMAATVSVNDPDSLLTGHTFVAYQILAGDYDETTKTLSNVTWGSGVDGEDLVAELKSDAYDSIFANAFDGLDYSKTSCASDLAKILTGYAETSAQIEKFIAIALTHKAGSGTALSTSGTDLAEGYYLIVDTTDVTDKDAVKNASLLQVAGDDIEINAKVEKPPVTKKVKENSEYTSDEGFGTGYNDVATYSIGDTVPFAIYSKVVDLSRFESYEMIFDDVMSKGLTIVESSITVTIAGVPLVAGDTADYHAKVVSVTEELVTDSTPLGSTIITFHIPDLKKITIDDGTGARAVKSGDEIVISYSATLNKDAIVGTPGNPNVVSLRFSNDPDSDGHGKTPEDKVIVFTMGLELDKVDGGNTAHKLKGVEFAIWKDNAKSSFAVVDSNKKFAGWVAVSSLTDVNSDGVVDPYDYSVAGNTAIHVTDIDGNVSIYGLDNGTYYIEETKELAGYNAIIGLMEIIVDADAQYTQAWDFTPSSALTGMANDSDGDWLTEKQILNHGGTVLPETGGIGTVLFIAIGCTLILGASVVMVTRKKMSVYED